MPLQVSEVMVVVVEAAGFIVKSRALIFNMFHIKLSKCILEARLFLYLLITTHLGISYNKIQFQEGNLEFI